MKTRLLFLLLLLSAGTLRLSAQLPPIAQALYDEAYAQDSLMVQFAIDNNAQIIATADGNSFYIKWFPNGVSPSSSPLIVSLHGSNGYAFHEFFNWYQLALLRGCGIIALQWYRGDLAQTPNDYFDETSIYNYIDSALTGINYPSNKAFLHGFSRGSARSYAVIFKDIQSGNNYFCTTLSNAGGADSTYPLYYDIDHGVHGTNVFAGKRWALFCAGQDSDPAQSGCIGMTNTQTWLQSQGASVDLFIQDPNMQHNGFQQQQPQIYRDSVLNYYLQCFGGTLPVKEIENHFSLKTFPNPANAFITIDFGTELVDADFAIYNSYGQKIKTIKNHSGSQMTLFTRDLRSGVYFVCLTSKNKGTFTTKFVVDKGL